MGRYDAADWDDEQEGTQDDRSESTPMRELRAADRAKAKRIKELETELSGLKSASRERSVKDVLSARGLNPKIAAFIPQDIDPTEEAISGWVDEFGDVFGIQPKESAPSAVPEDDVAALRQMDRAMESSQIPSGAAASREKILQVGSREELDALIGRA